MKTLRYCFIFVILLLIVSSVRAANVVWPMAYLSGHSFLVADTVFGTGSIVFIDLLYDGGDSVTLVAENSSAGLGHIWYQTSHGAAVDAHATAAAADPFVNAFTAELGSVVLPRNETVYLAFFIEGEANYYEATYGWASLVWDGTELRLTDSAAETTGVGIYAGTYTASPEPSAAGLLAAGLSALALRRRSRRQA